MIPDLNPEMQGLIDNISVKNLYGGNRIPQSIMNMFQIVEDENHIGILVPYWLSVLEHGRGPRRSNKPGGFGKAIYNWMAKHNLFKSVTPQGKLSEAKSVAWYINKYGNKQFRNKVFVDVFTTERQRTLEKIDKKFDAEITIITSAIL